MRNGTPAATLVRDRRDVRLAGQLELPAAEQTSTIGSVGAPRPDAPRVADADLTTRTRVNRPRRLPSPYLRKVC